MAGEAQEAVIMLDDKIVCVWFMQTLETQDWMCALRELVPDESYEIVFRFRYYNDDKVFGSTDRKSWSKATCQGTRNYALGGVRLVAKTLKEAGAIGELFEVLNDKGFDDFWRRFRDAPFAYVRAVGRPKDEDNKL